MYAPVRGPQDGYPLNEALLKRVEEGVKFYKVNGKKGTIVRKEAAMDGQGPDHRVGHGRGRRGDDGAGQRQGPLRDRRARGKVGHVDAGRPLVQGAAPVGVASDAFARV